MIHEQLYRVVRRPHISEKTARAGETGNQYVFEVAKNAGKSDVKAAVEALFKVKVENVNVVNLPARPKGFRGRRGYRNAWKKAYVRLAPGDSIDLVEGEQV